MKVILYSTGCPKCEVLKKKLEIAGVDYDVVNSVETMQELGFQELPKLSVGGMILGFIDAINWVNQNTK